MNYQESLDYLLGLGHETLAMKFGLRNTETLLGALDNPQSSFGKVQIAGTNGKGSTCAFLDAICQSANLRVGLYTSPHLVRITERIKINGIEIGETEFADLTTQVRRAAETLIENKKLETLPTFFEHLTLIALLAFRAAKVEVAILETGLGGRLDATTAARAEIAGFTQIALDHQEYLGDTIDKIAREKAAIIHSDTGAVAVAAQTGEIWRAIEERCRIVNNFPLLLNRIKANFKSSTADGKIVANFDLVDSESKFYQSVCLNLRGRHQLENAALAINIAESLKNDYKFQISDNAIVNGLETAEHFGRLEFQTIENRRVLFDGAHNAAGARALKSFLGEFFPNQPLTIVFALMRDKDAGEIAGELFPLARKLILTKADNSRSASPADLQTIALKTVEPSQIVLTENFAEAWQIAVQTNDLIVVTGSLYLVGEAKQTFESRESKVQSRESGES